LCQACIDTRYPTAGGFDLYQLALDNHNKNIDGNGANGGGNSPDSDPPSGRTDDGDSPDSDPPSGRTYDATSAVATTTP